MLSASGTDGAVPVEDYNYFNYFTEIEEYFWQKRGAHILVSTLDWAVIETWQQQGVPLEAVLKGIDRAFERWSRRRRPGRIKSLLFCIDSVADVVEEMRAAAAGRPLAGEPRAPAPTAFTNEEIASFLRQNAAQLRAAAKPPSAAAQTFADIAAALDALAEPAERDAPEGSGPAAHPPRADNLEDLERHLTVFEEKLLAALTQAATADELVALRREVERALAPYRRKMTAEQIALVEKQYLQKKLFEDHRLPRLSLFYLPACLGGPQSK
ncbi:MAG: hypothetical protein ACE5MH_08050 [Terriglobia bacterium]